MNSLVYNVKQGFTQILRNRGMSVASIFSILAMLFILGIFFVIVVNLNLFTEVVKQDYDQIEVYLKDEVTVEQAETLMGQIKTHEGAEGVCTVGFQRLHGVGIGVLRIPQHAVAAHAGELHRFSVLIENFPGFHMQPGYRLLLRLLLLLVYGCPQDMRPEYSQQQHRREGQHARYPFH